MFSYHVTRDLSAYCNGELSAEESRRVAEHLISCAPCRTQYEEVNLGVKLAQSLPVVSAPDELWETVVSQYQTQTAEVASEKRKFRLWQPQLVAVAASLVIVVALVGIWFVRRESRPFWDVVSLGGDLRIGNTTIKGKGQLPLGEWLETDNSSRAKIDVGQIGEVEIDPNTRIRLVETKPTEHRLELARGKMSARIWAPPRLFFVNTPSGVAADMGCAYTLEVDEQGGGILHVTSGWVALQLKDRESMVPAGAACATRPGVGPGTPYFEDASTTFRNALWKLDFEPGNEGSSLDQVLSESRPRDTLTLWHLLSRVDAAGRVRVYDRLALLAPPPEGVTREGVLQLDEQMLQLWKGQLENNWSDNSMFKKKLIDLWQKGGKGKGLEGKR
jgi:hypothetical protein